MAEKIKKLTKEQEQKLPEYREKWISLGLSAQKMDREKASAAIDQVYSCAGLPPPKIKIWLKSPYEGVIGAWWLKQILRTMRGTVLDKAKAKIMIKAGKEAGDPAGGRIRAELLAQIRNEVKDQVGTQVEDKIKEHIGEKVKDAVRDRLWIHVWNQVKDQMLKPEPKDPVWNRVWVQVWAQVWDQVWTKKPQRGARIGTHIRAEILPQIKDQVKSQIETLLENESYCAGLHDANFLAPYDFFGKELNLDVGKLSGLMSAAEQCGWFWPFGGAVIITEKPAELCRDDKNRLHNEKDMAVRYSDGWGVPLWHGTRVENWIIKNPELITLDKVLDEKNAGARRVLRERFGLQEFFFIMIKEGKAKRIGRKKDACGQMMTLFRYDDPDGAVYFVHACNGELEPDGKRLEFIITCKNVCDDAWDSLMGTYPDIMKDLKNNPRKFEILKSRIR